MTSAWIIVALLSGQPIVQKQIHVESKGCHLPAVKAEYPVDGQWRSVKVFIRCVR